jgi:hypothetical protein
MQSAKMKKIMLVTMPVFSRRVIYVIGVILQLVTRVTKKKILNAITSAVPVDV